MWYSKQGLWSLFLMCAFPLHLWTLILAFRDISWISERTNPWDAIGVASYGLVFAFFESLLLFAVALALGFLVSRRWSSDRRIAVLIVLVLILCLWAMLSQLFFLLGVSIPGSLLGGLAAADHPLRVLYALAALLVAPTILIPALLVLRSDRALRFVHAVVDRLAILAVFYLFFDVVSLMLVLMRNIE
jgi:hypothetical protein